jgi:protein-S-isoprenylcysteine O-methyltransferase Ste14
MDMIFLILSGCFLVCLAVRDSYELLKEAGKIQEGSRPAFIVVFIAMCGLWVSWFILCRLDPYRLGVPEAAQWAGRLVMGLGMLLAFGALMQLRGLEGIDHLVTRGLFRWFRHPMYLGFILWIVGWCIAWDAAAGCALGVPALLSILWWRHLEDRRLEVQFGEAYREYRKSTWF